MVIEYLPSMAKSLNSIPSMEKNKCINFAFSLREDVSFVTVWLCHSHLLDWHSWLSLAFCCRPHF